MSRYCRSVVVMLAGALFCGAAAVPAGLAQVAPKASDNTYNDQMLRMKPEEQAAKLASFLGMWCIGTRPFYMGSTKAGPAKGYAYWNVTCAGGKSYLVQLQPDGTGAATDCETLKRQGQGRECYKSF